MLELLKENNTHKISLAAMNYTVSVQFKASEFKIMY